MPHGTQKQLSRWGHSCSWTSSSITHLLSLAQHFAKQTKRTTLAIYIYICLPISVSISISICNCICICLAMQLFRCFFAAYFQALAFFLSHFRLAFADEFVCNCLRLLQSTLARCYQQAELASYRCVWHAAPSPLSPVAPSHKHVETVCGLAACSFVLAYSPHSLAQLRRSARDASTHTHTHVTHTHIHATHAHMWRFNNSVIVKHLPHLAAFL